MSELFKYAIVVGTDPDEVEALDGLRGSEATFAVERDGKVERIVHGIITEVAGDGAYVGKRQVRTTFTLEPRLANLRHGGRNAVFQDMSFRDVVAELVKPERIDLEWRVRPVPPKRGYRTQQNESSYEFIQRFAADEGVNFFFEHDADKTTLVFTNDPLGFHDMPERSTLSFRDVSGAVTGEHVRSVARAQRIRTGAIEHRDYNFRNPSFALSAHADTAGPENETNSHRRKVHDYPGGFIDPDLEGTPRAKMRLEELRSDAFVLNGTASTLRMTVGSQFTLKGHRDKEFNRKLLVTDVSFGATVAGTFAELTDGPRGDRASPSLVKFQAVPAETPVRPARRPKPAAHLRIARVVGPTEGSPFDDEFGRFKVQFIWDADGKHDEHSSCWVRTMTPVAHGDEGFWSAHKVGSEVLVSFVDGDIDRPIILGAVYNGGQKQAHKQPGSASRTSLKVRGIPGGTGYNELAFECEVGGEQIILHAQKDLNETVLHSHAETIGADQTSSVGSNQKITVGANRSLSVGADEKIAIGSNETTTVGANRTTTIASNESLTVGGNATKLVAEADTVVVGAARSLTAASEAVTVGTRAKTVLGDENTSVGGGRAETVGGDESVTIAGNRTVSIAGDESLAVEKTISMTAKEAFQAQAGDDAMFSMNKDGEILFKTGDSSILLKKNGDIEIKGKNVIVEADSDATVKGDNVAVKGSKVAVN